MAEVVAVTGLALLVLFVAQLRGVPFAAGLVGGAMFLGAHLQLFSGTQIGVLTRFVGMTLLLIVALSNSGRRSAEHRVPGMFAVASLGGVVYVTVTVATSDFAAFVAGLTFIFAVSVINKVSSSKDSEEILAGAFAALGLSVVLSASMYVGGYSEAIAGERLRGVFTNANTLGFFAALYILLLILRTSHSLRYGLVPIALASLLWSGSRSALLALGCALAAWSLMRIYRGNARGLGFTLAGVGGGVALLWWQRIFDPSIVFREGNSRDLGTRYALNVADWSLFSGVGYEQSIIEVASTPMRWLAEGGIFCVALIILAYILAFVYALPAGPSCTAISLFGIVSSLFEGWYIAGGSALFVYFWLAQATVSAQRVGSIYRGSADTATDPGVRSNGRGRPRLPGRVPQAGKFGAWLG